MTRIENFLYTYVTSFYVQLLGIFYNEEAASVPVEPTVVIFHFLDNQETCLPL